MSDRFPEPPRDRFRPDITEGYVSVRTVKDVIAENKPLVVPSVYDGISALLVKAVGLRFVPLSGIADYGPERRAEVHAGEGRVSRHHVVIGVVGAGPLLSA